VKRLKRSKQLAAGVKDIRADATVRGQQWRAKKKPPVLREQQGRR
jgi:hypothetical protein